MRGDLDGDAVLREVRAAIALERREAGRVVDLSVREVQLLDESDGLWRLSVSLPRSQRLQRWEGAFVYSTLHTEGAAWGGDVVAVDLAEGALVVQCGDERPVPGVVKARPMDFLRAPYALLTSERLVPVLPDYARLLGAAAGALAPPMGIHAESPLAPWTGHSAWTSGWAMVWGPPGTGKTHTLVEHVARLLARADERVLVLSTTNRATDEVALRLGRAVKPGLVKRLGWASTRAFRDAGLGHVLPEPAAAQAQLVEAEERLAAAQTVEARARASFWLSRLRRGALRLHEVVTDDEPRCVVTTLHAGLQAVTHMALELFHAHHQAPFTTVVLDEAGLVPRATAAAVGLLAARQVVLVGDPRQLSPICVAARSMESRVRCWLATSGMEHADRDDRSTQALLEQRRMHPAISGVVSRLQYEGLLQDHPSVVDRPAPEGWARLARWPRAAWVVLDRCAGLDATAVAPEKGGRRSWRRPAGLDVFARLLRRHPDLRRARGLFISPYRAQAEEAAAVLQGFDDTDGWAASTVHAQQGAEADVVVFDLVRHGGWPPPEWRRLVNVALSRARHQLVFLAATSELQQAWLAALHEELTPCVVSESGALSRWVRPEAQQGLFGTAVEPVPAAGSPKQPAEAPTLDPREAPPLAAEAAARRWGASPPDRAPDEPPSGAERAAARRSVAGAGSSAAGAGTGGSGSSNRPPPTPLQRLRAPSALGRQLRHSKAARRSMTRAQAQLVQREFADLGPRLVRGVAGSGKTIVLARWAAVELLDHPDKRATIVFGNLALEPHLKNLLAQAWRVTVDDPRAEPDWDRIDLVHAATLLRQLRGQAGLPPLGDGREHYDLEALSEGLAEAGLSPRFDLLYLDEAQDLGHAALQVLVDLCRPDPQRPDDNHRPVRIFYDNAQNVYGRSSPRWSDFGLDLQGRSTVLRESFRSTRPAMELTLDVLHQLRPLPEDPDFRALIQPRSGPPLLVWEEGRGWRADFCVVQGQAPEVALHDRRDDELAALVRRVEGWLSEEVRPRDVRVLALSQSRRDAACRALVDAGIPAVSQTGRALDPHTPRVLVTTPHSFKGYEADLVAVVGLDGFVTRDGVVLTQALYVALTRARTWMWVSATRVGPDVPSHAIVQALEVARAARPERWPVGATLPPPTPRLG